jgi:predicted transcriptional regulator
MATVSSPKQLALEVIRNLPDSATSQDILAELYFRQQVQEGLKQLDAGEVLSHEEVKRRLSKWLS